MLTASHTLNLLVSWPLVVSIFRTSRGVTQRLPKKKPPCSDGGEWREKVVVMVGGRKEQRQTKTQKSHKAKNRSHGIRVSMDFT